MTYLHRGIRFLYRLLMPFKYPQDFLIIVYKSEIFRAACSSLVVILNKNDAFFFLKYCYCKKSLSQSKVK